MLLRISELRYSGPTFPPALTQNATQDIHLLCPVCDVGMLGPATTMAIRTHTHICAGRDHPSPGSAVRRLLSGIRFS